jgi:hypothetical protein
MVQTMVLERWSQVTTYAKPLRCSIGLPHEEELIDPDGQFSMSVLALIS